ncbi:hypothetical protein TCE0_033r09586 [Talaromyces pinophilus]|uniref:Uncharacterized protein n=1 Tax=Talaromyces pinophilus TaxID=128442 RepID=A0A6V8HBU7_TALPI|nr:hypothetical protein TCE0_033r09586 [Talaromyces pinophilus]
MSQNQQKPRVKKEHPTHLSTIITSLLSAFESTRHLYQRIKNDTRSSAKKLNKRSPSTGPAVATPQTPEEKKLQLHLARAPRQIAKIFKTNSERLGEGYRRGDERAKTSLNHILLVLNTGLTRIISTLLRKKTGVDNEDMIRELMSLSERSARESVTELEGFRMRLESMSSLALSAGGRYSSVGQGGVVVRGRRRYNPKVQPGSVGEQLDGQKGSSTRQIGSPRTTGQGQNVKKKSIAPDASTATKTKRATNSKRTRQLQDIHPVWVRSKNSSTTSIHLRRMNGLLKPAGDDNKSRARQQSSHAATAVATSPADLELPTTVPARLRFPELQTQVSRTGRAETLLDRRISMLSHSSGSTKLGEIPQHKWINQWVPPVEIDEESGEDDAHEGGDNEDSGRTGIRFWRRFGRNRM